MELSKTRVACAAQNFVSGRPPGMRPEAIVLHRSGGTLDEFRGRFTDAAASTSAHYVVGQDGSVVQYVNEQDTAFHAGLVVNPVWTGLKPATNPNFYTIGIELEGVATDAVTEDQAEACAALIADVAARCDIPIDAGHLVLHSEIRASRDCPGSGFDRAEMVQRALFAASTAAPFPLEGSVSILVDTNLREGLPASSARTVTVLTSGTQLGVNGFTLQGEAVQGNSAWYRTAEGNFFWAGSTSAPEPRPAPASEINPAPASEAGPAPLPSAPPPAAPAGSRISIAEIDRFFTSAACPPLDLSNAGKPAVGVIQDLLTGHGFAKMPSLLSPAYGTFGDASRMALAAFQSSCGLPPDTALSLATLTKLTTIPAKDPRATQAHFSLLLSLPFTAMHRVLALTAQMEGVGKFAALNLNTDQAGLSFGLIQWAQRPGRLADVIAAFRAADADEFVRIFGAGDAGLADGLLAHVRKPSGGVDPATGITTDAQFSLIASPWADRFRGAALSPVFQKAQVDTARSAFENSLGRLRQYDTAGLVKSERAVAFLLDVANQFGDGHVQRPAAPPDKGLAGLYRKVFRPGMQEQELLRGIADETVAEMPARFQAGVRARRNLFLTTPLLADSGVFGAA